MSFRKIVIVFAKVPIDRNGKVYCCTHLYKKGASLREFVALIISTFVAMRRRLNYIVNVSLD